MSIFGCFRWEPLRDRKKWLRLVRRGSGSQARTLATPSEKHLQYSVCLVYNLMLRTTRVFFSHVREDIL